MNRTTVFKVPVFPAVFLVLLPESAFPIDKAADRVMPAPSLPLFVEQKGRLKSWGK